MKKLRNSKILIAAAAVVLLAGCTTPRQLNYLQDIRYNDPYDAPPAPELKLQKEDRIDIQVLCEDPVLAAPFNGIQNLSDASSAATSDTKYTVDGEGCIVFPVLGKLNIEGKTLEEVKKDITDRIVRSGYIKEPDVKVKMDNFSVIVLGSLGNRTIKVDGPSINLFQVLAQATAPNETADIKKVTVVRTQDGQRTAYPVDLRTTSIYDSPVFYLQQNDMVYVKYRTVRVGQTTQTVMSFVSMATMLLSLYTSFTILTR